MSATTSAPTLARTLFAATARSGELPGTFASGDPLDVLPVSARAKMERARADRDAAGSAYRGASVQWQEEWAEAGRVEGFAKSRLAMAPGFQVDYTHRDGAAVAKAEYQHRLAEHEARILAPANAAKRRLAAAVAARDRAAERLSAFDFVQGVEDWLSSTVRPGVRFSEAPAVQLGRIRDTGAEIAAVRAKLDAVAAELAEVDRAPVPSAMLREQAIAEIDRVAADGALEIYPTHRGGTPLNLAQRLGASSRVGASVIVWLLRDQFVARVDDVVADLRLDGAMTDAERDAAFARLANERLELERREEALVVLAEAEGRTIVRRPDLDPRAFLGIVA